MLLWTATITCRMSGENDDDGDPKINFGLSIEVEDGVPEVVVKTIPRAIENVGRQSAEQIEAGNINRIERS